MGGEGATLAQVRLAPSPALRAPSPRGGEGDESADQAQRTAKAPTQSRDLELRKLLHRFLDVCNAVDYAHSRGVVHRDIKPANIILPKHGETLVVDWGLAKAVGRADPSVGEQTIAPSSSGSSETMPGSAMGTPAYMSPEQACGDLDRLGPRSDVYSLGATLYCLLTGKPPFEGEDVGEILRKVQRGDFVPPRQLESSLDAALEAVCLKAMANQPGDRYPSCRTLADDVERWMADEPVSAWAEPWTRKLSRWPTRHRTGVTGAAAAVLAGVVGLSAVLAVQARANASLADKNSELLAANAKIEARYNLAVDAIKTFHTGVSEDFLLKEDKFKELRDRLLKSASDFYGKLGALLGKETDVASRQALAQSNFELADLTGKVGRTEDALAVHRAVLAAREALAAEPGAGVVAKVDVGPQLDRGRRAARSDGQDGRGAGGLPAVGVAAGRPGRARGAGRAGGLSTRMGAPLRDRQDRRRAGGLPAGAGRPGGAGRRPRGLERRPPRPGGHDLPHRHPDVVHGQAGGGVRPSPARRWRSSKSWSTTTPPSPNSAAAWRAATAASAALLASTGKPAEAEAEFRKALALRQKLADDNPAVTEFRSGLAYSHNDLGGLLSEQGQAGGGGGRVPQGAGDPAEAGRRQPRRHRIPQRPGGQPLRPRHPAVEHGQASGGGGRVPQGAGDPAEAGRRQPRRHRLPRWPGLGLSEGSCPPGVVWAG